MDKDKFEKAKEIFDRIETIDKALKKCNSLFDCRGLECKIKGRKGIHAVIIEEYVSIDADIIMDLMVREIENLQKEKEKLEKQFNEI